MRDVSARNLYSGKHGFGQESTSRVKDIEVSMAGVRQLEPISAILERKQASCKSPVACLRKKIAVASSLAVAAFSK